MDKFVVKLKERGHRKGQERVVRTYEIPAPSSMDAHEWGQKQADSLGVPSEVEVLGRAEDESGEG